MASNEGTKPRWVTGGKRRSSGGDSGVSPMLLSLTATAGFAAWAGAGWLGAGDSPWLMAALGAMAAAWGWLWLHWRRRMARERAAALADAAGRGADVSGWPVDLAADLGHELRTPLHGVIGMLSLLRETDMDATQADYVEGAWNSANHLMAVLNNVVDMSRIEAGRMEVHQEPVDMARLVRDMGGLASPMAKAKGLGFHTRVDDAMPRWVKADPTRVRQVLFNLLSNAVKFSDKGEVELSVTLVPLAQGEARLRFVVRDQGIGMDAHTVAALFQRFSRGSAAHRRRTEGAGLGLQISLALARLMGGDILVASQPGVGSTFEMTLPCEPCTGPEVDSARNGELVAAAGTLRVLVAEDHPVNRRYLAALLSRLGHESVLCSNGTEVVAAAAAGDFDVILMDIRMPGMDGLEATRRIRERLHHGERLTIVALTADATAESRHRAMEAGMVDFLAKPVRPAELALVLERVGGRNSNHSGNNGVRRASAEATPAPDVIVDLCESLGAMGYRDLVFELCDEAGATLSALRRALAAGDPEAVGIKAHEVKGAALTLGLAGMADAASHIEEARTEPARREAEWNRLLALLPRVRDEAVVAAANWEKAGHPDHVG